MKFSAKQWETIAYWNKNKPLLLINEGAVRSGKTVVDNWMFGRHVWSYRDCGVDFIITGHTVPSVMRNVLQPLSETLGLDTKLDSYNRFVVGLYDTRSRPYSELGYSTAVKLFIAQIAAKETYTSVFANPYTIAGLPGVEQSKILLVGYQVSDEMQRSAVKVLTGKLKASGRLPVTINTFFKFGDGIAAR